MSKSKEIITIADQVFVAGVLSFLVGFCILMLGLVWSVETLQYAMLDLNQYLGNFGFKLSLAGGTLSITGLWCMLDSDGVSNKIEQYI